VIPRDSTAEWASHRIRAGQAVGQVPRYGSAAWLRLGDRDPRKVAAVVIAAEAWRWDSLELPDRLAGELDEARRTTEELDAAEWSLAAASVRRTASTPTLLQLERRRWGDGGRAAFGRPRPGDFEGMAVTS